MHIPFEGHRYDCLVPPLPRTQIFDVFPVYIRYPLCSLKGGVVCVFLTLLTDRAASNYLGQVCFVFVDRQA